MGNVYDLVKRVPIKSHISSYEEAVNWDMNMRKGALVPYQKAGDRIVKLAKNGDIIVDVGVNSGTVAFYIAGQRKDAILIGLEENSYLLEVANDNLNLLFWSNFDCDIEFEETPLSELPLEDHCADIVYSHSSLHLWENPASVIEECKRICKDDGIIIIDDFNRGAEEGYISFVLQYIRSGQEHFLEAVRASYNIGEMKRILKEIGLDDWKIYEEEMGFVISSRELDMR